GHLDVVERQRLTGVNHPGVEAGRHRRGELVAGGEVGAWGHVVDHDVDRVGGELSAVVLDPDRGRVYVLRGVVVVVDVRETDRPVGVDRPVFGVQLLEPAAPVPVDEDADGVERVGVDGVDGERLGRPLVDRAGRGDRLGRNVLVRGDVEPV